MSRTKKSSGKRGGRKSKALQNKDIERQIIKVAGTLAPSQGINVNNYMYGCIQADPTSIWAQAVFQTTDFQLQQKQYDKFKIEGFNIKFIPRVTQAIIGDQINADARNTFGEGSNTIYSCIDRGGTPPAMNIGAFKKYASVLTHSALKPWSRSYRLNNSGELGWLDAYNNGRSNTPILKEAGYEGGIFFYAENLPEPNSEIFNAPWYDIEITYYLLWRGKAVQKLTAQPPYMKYISTLSFAKPVEPNTEGYLATSSIKYASTLVYPVLVENYAQTYDWFDSPCMSLKVVDNDEQSHV